MLFPCISFPLEPPNLPLRVIKSKYSRSLIKIYNFTNLGEKLKLCVTLLPFFLLHPLKFCSSTFPVSLFSRLEMPDSQDLVLVLCPIKLFTAIRHRLHLDLRSLRLILMLTIISILILTLKLELNEKLNCKCSVHLYFWTLHFIFHNRTLEIVDIKLSLTEYWKQSLKMREPWKDQLLHICTDVLQSKRASMDCWT